MSRRTNYVLDIQHGDVHLGTGDEPPLASHLVTPRAFYMHHGIYVGSGRVIHYAGLAHRLRRGPVEQVSLEHFARGHTIWIRRSPQRFDSCEVVARARSRLGESHYRILTNNCEHFCAWALRDERLSWQIERLAAIPSALYRAFRAVLRMLKVVHECAPSSSGNSLHLPRHFRRGPGTEHSD
jgi:hypothetical protein